MTGKIGVVGAGLMGAEIALVYALAGYDVLLSDRTEDALKSALDRLAGILDKGAARGLYNEAIKRARAAAELVKDRRPINEEGETIESDVSPELAGQRI